MAVSTTTFEERLSRINKGQTVDVSAQVGGRKKKSRSIKARCLTFPFLIGVSILAGGAAYAFVTVQPEMDWVIALAG